MEALIIAVACLMAEPVTFEVADNPAMPKVVAELPAGADLPPAGSIDAQDGESFLQVRRQGAEATLVGRYERQGLMLSFEPRLPLAPGVTYIAAVRRADGTIAVTEYQIPVAKLGELEVTEVWPNAKQLPANVLKFYLHFSQPMRGGVDVFDRIKLLDHGVVAAGANLPPGKELPEVWRRVDLWSTDQQRLTLYIHPGRIKQGVNLREEFGPVLTEGHTYTLEISTDMQSGSGSTLAEPFRYMFVAGPDDRKRPLPQEWEVSQPAAASKEPLRVDFHEPMDPALAKRHLLLLRADGADVAGTVAVSPDSMSWTFTPAEPWRPEPYVLTIDEELEDAAGNTPTRLFDTDLTQPAGEAPELLLELTPRS